MIVCGIFGFIKNDDLKYKCCAIHSSQKPVHCGSVSITLASTSTREDVINVSENFINFFKRMFWLYSLQIVAVIFTSMGTKALACKCVGGMISVVGSVATMVLMVYGFKWAWSHGGRVCSGDYLESAPKDDRYWIGYGMAVRFTLIVQLFTVCC